MEVNCSDVNFSEVKLNDLFVEKCVLSLIYSNVALCSFPVINCVIICFYLLFYELFYIFTVM